jgi:hypothetical protein
MRRIRAAHIVFYGGLLLLMTSILLQFLGDVLPAGLAARVGFNSEGYVLALVVAAWIQFARPRLAEHGQEWPVTLTAGLACLAGGIALLATDLPSRFRTLNESLLAASVVLLYVQLRRPLPRWVPIALSGGIFAVTVFFSHTALITGLAEMLGVLILVPLAVDVFDRGILDPEARTSPAMRYGFYAALAAVPTAFMILERTVDAGGVFGAATRYGVRMHEAFVGVLLVVLFFAVLRALRDREATFRKPELLAVPQPS